MHVQLESCVHAAVHASELVLRFVPSGFSRAAHKAQVDAELEPGKAAVVAQLHAASHANMTVRHGAQGWKRKQRLFGKKTQG